MNNGIARIVAMALAAAVVQQVLMSRLSIAGVHPDVLLGFAIVVAATGGANRGAAAGFFAGLLTDIFTGTSIGSATLSYTVAAFAIGTLSDDTTDYPWVIFLTVLGGSALGVVLYVAVGGVLGDVHTHLSRILTVGGVVALVNAPLAPLVARVLRNAWQVQKDFAW